jgi:hypothetical protein
MPAYWPFPSFPLSPFSRNPSPSPSATPTAHTSFPFFSRPPSLSTTDTPSCDDLVPVTPAQRTEWEDQDLLSVDRALMDFAAGEVGRGEKDVRVKALWVHPIKVSPPSTGLHLGADEEKELSRCFGNEIGYDLAGPSGEFSGFVR